MDTEDEKAPIRIPNDASILARTIQKDTHDKLKNMDNLMYAIVVAIVITAVSALISVGAIIIDQLHFNNLTYRDGADLAKDNLELRKEILGLQLEIETVKFQLQNEPIKK